MFRLTPWSNDPVTESSGEAFYLRDEESGKFYSPSPAPARGKTPYTTRHGFGYSYFEHVEGGISSEMAVFVAMDAPVKFITFKIRNRSTAGRRLSLSAFFELVLGDRRSSNLMHIVTEVDPKTGAILASNPYNPDFSERAVFLDCSETNRTLTGDRLEFLGRNGSPERPAAMDRVGLSGRAGAGLDPCAAMQCVFDLAPGQEKEIAFIFGCGRDKNDARTLVNRFRGTGKAREAVEHVWEYWNNTLGAVYVQTPVASVNYLVNGWLLYQTLGARYLGTQRVLSVGRGVWIPRSVAGCDGRWSTRSR